MEEGVREVYYDVETQKSADEVGGWANVDQMLVSVAVGWSSRDGFRRWQEHEMPTFIAYLIQFDRIISYNGDSFDSKVLSHYGDVSLLKKKSFDLHRKLKEILGHRIGLDAVAQATLGSGKTADGLTALRWWKEGQVEKIAQYCEQDVQVLVDLVKFARTNGFVRYTDLSGFERVIPVKW